MSEFDITFVKTKTVIVDTVTLRIEADDANKAVERGYGQLFETDTGWELDTCKEIGNKLDDILIVHHIPIKYHKYPDGVPCDHPGCASHISHPCEGCGRIGASAELTKRWREKQASGVIP